MPANDNSASSPAAVQDDEDDNIAVLDGSLSLLGDDDLPLPAGHTRSLSSSTSSSHLLTFTNTLALVIGLQIGSGIFAAPSQVSQHVSSPLAAVSAWLLGGLLVWTGAASFVELGTAMPRNGGIAEYLHACYGDFPAFLFAGMWCLVVKPCAMALIAIVFAENLCRGVSPGQETMPLLTKGVAVAALAAIVYVNCKGVKTGALVGNVFLALKLFTVVSVGILGLGAPWLGTARRDHQPVQKNPKLDRNPNILAALDDYVTALFGVLFCYGGWETVGFVAGDMRDPVRDLPRVINTAMIIVMLGFVFMVSSLYLVLSMGAMRKTNTPIVDFGTALFGVGGGRFYSIIASLCALGALHSTIFTTARLCVAAAKRSYLPRVLDHPAAGGADLGVPQGRPTSLTLASYAITALPRLLRVSPEAPVAAILFSAVPSLFFVLLGTFRGLVTFYGKSFSGSSSPSSATYTYNKNGRLTFIRGICEYIFFFLTVLGLFKLRQQAVSDPKPHQGHYTWTLNPVIFCCLSVVLVTRGIINDPMQGAGILCTLLAGALLYNYTFHRARARVL